MSILNSLRRPPTPTQLRPLPVRPATPIRHRAQKRVTAALESGGFAGLAVAVDGAHCVSGNGSFVDQAEARQEAKRSTPGSGLLSLFRTQRARLTRALACEF